MLVNAFTVEMYVRCWFVQFIGRDNGIKLPWWYLLGSKFTTYISSKGEKKAWVNITWQSTNEPDDGKLFEQILNSNKKIGESTKPAHSVSVICIGDMLRWSNVHSYFSFSTRWNEV